MVKRSGISEEMEGIMQITTSRTISSPSGKNNGFRRVLFAKDILSLLLSNPLLLLFLLCSLPRLYQHSLYHKTTYITPLLILRSGVYSFFIFFSSPSLSLFLFLEQHLLCCPHQNYIFHLLLLTLSCVRNTNI